MELVCLGYQSWLIKGEGLRRKKSRSSGEIDRANLSVEPLRLIGLTKGKESRQKNNLQTRQTLKIFDYSIINYNIFEAQLKIPFEAS